MAAIQHDKLIYEDVRSLAMFSRIFGYEFLIKNYDRMETAFYYSSNNFICVMYKHEPNKNLMIGFYGNEPDGVFIGYYDDDGKPAIEGADHYMFVSLNDEDNARAIVSQKSKILFGVDLDL